MEFLSNTLAGSLISLAFVNLFIPVFIYLVWLVSYLIWYYIDENESYIPFWLDSPHLWFWQKTIRKIEKCEGVWILTDGDGRYYRWKNYFKEFSIGSTSIKYENEEDIQAHGFENRVDAEEAVKKLNIKMTSFNYCYVFFTSIALLATGLVVAILGDLFLLTFACIGGVIFAKHYRSNKKEIVRLEEMIKKEMLNVNAASD